MKSSVSRQTVNVHAGLNGVVYDSKTSVLVKYKKKRVPCDIAKLAADVQKSPAKSI